MQDLPKPRPLADLSQEELAMVHRLAMRYAESVRELARLSTKMAQAAMWTRDIDAFREAERELQAAYKESQDCASTLRILREEFQRDRGTLARPLSLLPLVPDLRDLREEQSVVEEDIGTSSFVGAALAAEVGVVP